MARRVAPCRLRKPSPPPERRVQRRTLPAQSPPRALRPTTWHQPCKYQLHDKPQGRPQLPKSRPLALPAGGSAWRPASSLPRPIRPTREARSCRCSCCRSH
eukprot:39981-Chlamydomonas_euryale.AAC.3